MATSLSSTFVSMTSVVDTPVNGNVVPSSSSPDSKGEGIVKKEEGVMLSVGNEIVDDHKSSFNSPLPVKNEEDVLKKEEDVSMPMSAIEDTKPTPPPPSASASGSTTPALPPPVPKRTGPQLIPELPVATDDALATFTQLKDNHYQYQTLGRSREAEEGMMCDCHYVHGEDDPSAACGDGSDCINRLTQIECVEGECRCRRWCQNQRFEKKQYANIEIVQTEKKGFGLRAAETIPKDEFIYEYIGDVISHPSFMKRMRDYASEGIKHFYFMMLQKEEYIDATKRGGIARFANHSCAPNCYVAKWTVGPRVRMGIFASRTIHQYEELTFNYNVDRYGHDAQPCYCGEPNCVGFLGGKTQTDIGGMDTLFLDALGITDEVEALGLKGSKKKKGKKLDEDYTPILKPMVELEAPKLIRALNQTTSRKVLLKLLTRIRMTEDLGALRQLMRLRGYSLMNRVLGDYMKDHEIVLLVLEGIKRWPLLQRNKIEDSKVDVPVSKLASTSEDERVKTLAQELLDYWSTLETAYRIPKREWNGTGESGPSNEDTFFADREREREERAREDAAKRARYAGPDMPKWTFVPAVVKPASPKKEEKPLSKPTVKVVYRDEQAIRAAAYREVQAMMQRAKEQAQAEQEAAVAKAAADALKAEKEATRRERKLKGPISAEEKEALKEKRLQKLISPVVVKALSKHRDVLDNDAFKKHAKELTQIIADKEKKSSSYKAGQLDSLSEEKTVKMKKFAKEYIAKILRKLSKAIDGTNGTSSNGASSSSSKRKSSRQRSGNGHTSTRTSSSLSLTQVGADDSAIGTPIETDTPDDLENDSMGVDVDFDGDVDMDDPDSPPSPGDHDRDKGDVDVSTSNSPSAPSTPIGGGPDKQPTTLDPRLLKTKSKQDREPARTALASWFPDQEGEDSLGQT